MPNRLDVPPELAALIEKRNQERRAENDAVESVEDSPTGEERRTGSDRRASDTPEATES